MKKPSLELISRPQALLISALVALMIGLSQFGAGETFSCNGQPMTEAQIAAYRGISLETLHLLHRARGLTPDNICAMPQDKLNRAIFRANTPKPDHPGEAVEFRNMQLQDENGFIPPDGLLAAKAQMDAMRAEQEVGAAEAGIAPGSWTWIGPGNIGGRIRAIVIHPTTPNTMWIGSVSGGIWKTTDGGVSWSIQDDFMANMAVSALIIDPTDSNTLYAGTGEGFFNGDAIRGAGVFKTTNGGGTWTQLANTNDANFYYVNRLAISPNGATILAATGSGIWRSADDGANWSLTSFSTAFDINFDPSNSNKAVAGGSGGQAWYSIDGGASWSAATFSGMSGFPGRVEIAYAPSNPSIVYASVNRNGGEIWKSTDGGAIYNGVSSGYSYLGNQGWYDNALWVDPTNANILIVGGIDLWRSTNGGATLSQISIWYCAPPYCNPYSAHADHHVIVQHPSFNGTSNTTVFFGNDGGIYKTANVYTVDDTTGWTELNNNLGITQFYGAAGNPTTGDIIGGTQDNGTLFYSGSQSWGTTEGGDGGWSAADPVDPNYFYGEYVYLNIHRSSDGGASADYISGQYWDGFDWAWKNPPYRIEDAFNSDANFIAPFILDPNNANRLLGGGLSLWRTNNAKAANTFTVGPSWSAIKSSTGSYISAIAVAPGNSDIIWVGHNNGNVYKTANGTAASPTWTQVDTNSPGLPNRIAMRITIDATDHNKVYVTFSGFSDDNVWRTADGGSTWNDITGGNSPVGLPDLPVRSLVIQPFSPDWLYVGTELGIFASEDGGATWGLPHDGPTNTSVDELFWLDNDTLVAATHGRGLFTANVLFNAPGIPTLVAPAHNSTTTDYTPTLDWNDSTGNLDHYQLQVDDNSNFSSPTIDDSTLTTSDFTPGAPLNADVTYYWRVRAYNNLNQSFGWSSTFTFKTIVQSPAPANLAANSTRPVFDWNNVSGADSYSIQISTSQTFATLLVNLNVSASAYVPTVDLPRGVLIFWRVKANGALGASNWSRTRHFDSATPPTSAPLMVAPAAGAAVTGSPTLDWNDLTPAPAYYEVQISTDNFATWLGRGRGGRTAVSQYTVELALASNAYYWRVRAVNYSADGLLQFGPWSARRAFVVP
ncbi:MAG: hypothetical protein HYZ49_00800 [Chloroflexi bacterium]|nr:hypothetical protein [Chloroflexota bacterium]